MRGMRVIQASHARHASHGCEPCEPCEKKNRKNRKLSTRKILDKIIQPIAQKQKSYLKDTTDFVNFIERTTLPKDVILVSMDVTSLYTNIPQEEGINIVCTAYENFYRA